MFWAMVVAQLTFGTRGPEFESSQQQLFFKNKLQFPVQKL